MSLENENENENTNKPGVTCFICGALLSPDEAKNSEADMKYGMIKAPMCDLCFEVADSLDKEDWDDED